ncbi:phage replisome organizer N-terminal domain-containing protein [Clostridium beijerinckii]|uniref:phage replisome organizer N-terminal domain-containing protein n=1 Tax=Clostridium beijerinckii TaxID=1520 RepID=UPI0014942E3D
MSMKERRYVRFRVDMYEDTKFKIIDRMPKRDLVHYVWNRIVILAGKVNREGELYMSRNIPYTVETLAIEFNRDSDEMKAALDELIDLEMIEITDDKVYKVKNFVKHQNIKVREKSEAFKEENKIKTLEKIDMNKNESIEADSQNAAPIQEKEEVDSEKSKNNEITFSKLDNQNLNNENKSDKNIDLIRVKRDTTNQHNNFPVIFEVKNSESKKKGKAGKKKNEGIIEVYDEDVCDDISDERNKDNAICWFSEGEITLEKGQTVIAEWSFH